MEKDFENLIVARCAKTLTSNEKYVELTRSDAEQEEVQDMAQILCYAQGYADAMAVINYSQKLQPFDIIYSKEGTIILK